MRGWSAITLVGLVGLAACTVEASRERAGSTQSVEQAAAWYDQYESSSGPWGTLWYIPRHVTCADLEIGNASAGVDEGIPSPSAGACSSLTFDLALDGNHTAMLDFRDDAAGPACQGVAWSATRPIAGVVVNGSLDGGAQSTGRVIRFATPKLTGLETAQPDPVDGAGVIEGVELCYTTDATGGEPDAGGSANDAGTGGSSSDGGAGSDAGSGTTSDGGGGKTW